MKYAVEEIQKKKDKRKKTWSLPLCPLPLCGRLSQTIVLELIGTTCPNSLWLAGTFRSWVRSHLELKVPGDFQSR